ncbi:hypothetical protein ACFC18_50810 [Streptomyces sp. NPDC056121]|uniref:hypothetical protein n=1 Tax=Streptomyces sp. NPDC056121 TaxID=3345718 RepID=UPI0035DF8592
MSGRCPRVGVPQQGAHALVQPELALRYDDQFGTGTDEGPDEGLVDAVLTLRPYADGLVFLLDQGDLRGL